MALEYQTPVTFPAPNDGFWKRSLLLVFVWAPLGLFFTAVASVVTGLACTYMGFVTAPILGLFGAYSLYHMQKIRRNRRAMMILTYLETATRLNLPLNEYLLAAELSESGATRIRLHDLRDLLSKGVPLGTALYEAVPEMPASIIATLRVTESLGQLQVTLKRYIDEVASKSLSSANERLPFYRFYGVGLCIVICNLTAGYMIFIVPKFKEIFRDFAVSLPVSTTWLINAADFSMDESPLAIIVLGLMFMGVLCSVGWMLERTFMLRRQSETRRGIVDRILWWTPVIAPLVRAKAMGEVYRVLADTSRAGIPLPTALDHAENLHINTQAKKQITDWQHGLESGLSPAAAAKQAGMPELVVGLLNPAQSRSAPGRNGVHSVAEVFEFLARYYRGKFSRLAIAIQAATEPVLVMTLGLFVGFLCVALISPLAKLIGSLAGVYSRGL